MRVSKGVFVLVVAACALFLGPRALHAENYGDTSQQHQDQQKSDWQSASKMDASFCQASSIIGKQVRSPAGEDLGSISDLALNRSQGRVVYAVLSSGGFLGLGNSLFAVPLRAITFSSDGKSLTLSVAQDRLRNAQGFDDQHWPPEPQYFLMSAVPPSDYPSYGMPNSGQDSGTAESSQRQARVYGDQNLYRDSQYQHQPRAVAGDSAYGGEGSSQRTAAPGTYGYPAGQENQPQHERQQSMPQGSMQGGPAAMVDWPAQDNLRWANRASKVIGASVYDPQQNRSLGEIRDLAIDLASGYIAFAAVDPADELNVAQGKLVAVPWNGIQLNAQDNHLMLTANRQAVQQAAFDENHWPTMADARGLLQPYGPQVQWPTYGYQHSAQPQFQSTQDTDSQRFDPRSETKLSGQITAVRTTTLDGEPMLEIRLSADGQERTVHIGPPSRLPGALSLQNGKQVQVMGSQVQAGSETILIAREIRVDDRSFTLRDSQGKWTAQPQDSQGWRQNQQDVGQ